MCSYSSASTGALRHRGVKEVQAQHEAFTNWGLHGNNTLANCRVLKG
jgi:hypothetical protein